MTSDEAFAILELEVDADMRAVRRQYRRLASRLHPDRFPDAEEKRTATERFQAVGEAFTLLRALSGETDEQIPLADAIPIDRKRSKRRGPSYSAWATAAQQAAAQAYVEEPEEDPEEAARRRRFAALSSVPHILRHPSYELALDVVILPSLLATSLAHVFIALVRDQFEASEETAGLVGTLIGHLVPGAACLTIGYFVVRSPSTRGLLAIAFATWWLMSGAIAAVLDQDR